MRRLAVALVLTSLTAFGCDEAPKEDGRPTKVGGEEVPTVKEVKEAAKSAGPEDCGTYFKQVVDTCNDSIHDGLKLSCHTLYMSAKVAKKQKEGKLFKDPNGKVSASELGDANCAVNIKSLAKKRAKAETEPKISWGPKCKAYFKGIEDKCLTPATKGEFKDDCMTPIMQIKMLKRKDDREKHCETMTILLPK